MDIDKFRQQLKAELDAKKQKYAADEKMSIEHAQRVLNDFFSIVGAVNDVSPGFATVKGGDVNEFGIHECSVVFGSRRISFATSPHNTSVDIQGMDDELRAAIPEEPQRGLIQGLRDQFAPRSIADHDLHRAAEVFANIIRKEALRKNNL